MVTNMAVNWASLLAGLMATVLALRSARPGWRTRLRLYRLVWLDRLRAGL